MKFYFSVFLVFINVIYGHIPTKNETIIYQNDLNANAEPKCFSIPEGGFVYYFHPNVKTWLEHPLTKAHLEKIENELKPSLEISLTKEGFSQAVTKEEGNSFGDISYSAIWVRDCCWHYYGLKIHHQEDARKLISSLLNFYSTDNQIFRFLSIIAKPELANPELNSMAHMDVPLIRFSSKSLSHHQIENKDQEWNHLQFDSHGLFLLALADALSSGILPINTLSEKNYVSLTLFPAFFTQTNYAEKKDAGPWEDIMQLNASSAGLVASGIKRIMEVLTTNEILSKGLEQGLFYLQTKTNTETHKKIASALTNENIENLYKAGMRRVEKNLSLGGEAPNIEKKDLDRRADVALLFLALIEHTPFFNDSKKIKEILNLTSSLIGPYGIYRYHYDPYQSLNYWITFDKPSPIFGAKTALFNSIISWQKGYMPHRQVHDAQWFFDSCFADIYYHLSMLEEEIFAKTYYLQRADIHVKRAIAQLTGINAYAANGAPVAPLQLPESINSVSNSFFQTKALPSPISPLNWAKAALQMAITRGQNAHAQFEQNQK